MKTFDEFIKLTEDANKHQEGLNKARSMLAKLNQHKSDTQQYHALAHNIHRKFAKHHLALGEKHAYKAHWQLSKQHSASARAADSAGRRTPSPK